MSQNSTAAAMLRGKELAEKAIALRKRGMTYRAIADICGVSEAGAYKAVKRELRRLNEKLSEQAEEIRRLELERLDAMLESLADKVMMGRETAIDRALRIMERRARLLGLDAPARQELTGADGGPLAIDFGDTARDTLLGRLLSSSSSGDEGDAAEAAHE